MDALHALPVPATLHDRVKALSHDLQRARVDLAMGKLPPGDYARVTGDLESRLRHLEAEVHARMLHAAARGLATSWRPKAPAAG
jgi:hypothetical protein